jgi:aminoglycoside/choline kinase family phosphotransferase
MNNYGSKSSIIIDFSRVKDISDEYLHVCDIYDASQYEFYREINRFLYMKIPHCIGCRVPEIYASSDYAKSLQMEDLGSVSLVDVGFKFSYYRDIIRWLAHLDKLYRNKNIQYYIKYRRYEIEAINDELSDFIQYCGEDYMELIENILAKVKMVPMSICHRDFQPRNIMIHNGEPRVIDVQDMCIGPMTYDLGSLLYDPFVVVSKSDIHVLTTLYSFITNRDSTKIQKWTKVCGKIRLMKMAGRHAKLYKQTKNEDNKLRSEMAIKRLLSI